MKHLITCAVQISDVLAPVPKWQSSHKQEVRCSPEPEELGEDGSYEAVDEDVSPHQLAGELKGLEPGVVEQEEARPQQQQVEQTHKAWETSGSSTLDLSHI